MRPRILGPPCKPGRSWPPAERRQDLTATGGPSEGPLHSGCPTSRRFEMWVRRMLIFPTEHSDWSGATAAVANTSSPRPACHRPCSASPVLFEPSSDALEPCVPGMGQRRRPASSYTSTYTCWQVGAGPTPRASIGSPIPRSPSETTPTDESCKRALLRSCRLNSQDLHGSKRGRPVQGAPLQNLNCRFSAYTSFTPSTKALSLRERLG